MQCNITVNRVSYSTLQLWTIQYRTLPNKDSGKNNNNSRPIKPNSKTNIITDGVMTFLGVIVTNGLPALRCLTVIS